MHNLWTRNVACGGRKTKTIHSNVKKKKEREMQHQNGHATKHYLMFTSPLRCSAYQPAVRIIPYEFNQGCQVFFLSFVPPSLLIWRSSWEARAGSHSYRWDCVSGGKLEIWGSGLSAEELWASRQQTDAICCYSDTRATWTHLFSPRSTTSLSIFFFFAVVVFFLSVLSGGTH